MVLSAGLRIWICRISSTCLAISGRNGQPAARGPARRNHPTIGQQLAGVLEEDHAVAQQAPPLLGVGGDAVGGVAVRVVRWRARGPV